VGTKQQEIRKIIKRKLAITRFPVVLVGCRILMKSDISNHFEVATIYRENGKDPIEENRLYVHRHGYPQGDPYSRFNELYGRAYRRGQDKE